MESGASPTWDAFLEWHLVKNSLTPWTVVSESEIERAAFDAWQAGMAYALVDLLPAFKEACAWLEHPATGGLSKAALNRKLTDWIAIIEKVS